jgi:trimeric autotransporter adhesin
MKKLSVFLFYIGLLQTAMAQVPNQFNYQAVARNSAGQGIPNASIRVRFTVLDGSATGTNVYSEVRLLTTNQLGLFTAPIGGTGATSVTGNFATINWGTGKKFIKVEADPLGGTNYILLGNTEMLSVPYALYAVNGKVGPAGPANALSIGTVTTGTAGSAASASITGTPPAQTLNLIIPAGAKGAQGIAGPQGLPGKNMLIFTAAEPAGANCISGGIKQQYGIDANDNGVLDAGEINPALTTYVCNGLAATATSFWNIDGNAGTSAINFIGTTDAQPLKFKINNSTAGEINDGNNTTLGYFAGAAMASNSSTGIGAFSLANTTGYQNTGVGFSTLYSNSTGHSNVAVGTNALFNNTDKSNLVAIGDSALYNNGTGVTIPFQGTENTAVGSKALYSNTIGSGNTANGYLALLNNTEGIKNTANGETALYNNTSGSDNTANGSRALWNNTTGVFNTANGVDALWSNTTGSFNTANGYLALSYNKTGSDYNTAIGSRALVSIFSGSYNVGVGYTAGYYSSPTASNQIAIGSATGYPASNTAIIGNASQTWIGGQVGWSSLSDGRIKDNIQDNVPGLSFIRLLRPVTYNLNIRKQQQMMANGIENNKDIKKDAAFYAHKKEASKDWQGKYDIEKITQTGFVAQEVEAAAKKLNYNFSGVTKPPVENGLYSLRYTDFVMPLVKAVQEQQEQIEMLQKQNDELLKRITVLENKK